MTKLIEKLKNGYRCKLKQGEPDLKQMRRQLHNLLRTPPFLPVKRGSRPNTKFQGYNEHLK